MDSIFEVRWSKQFCPRFCPMKTEKAPIGRSLPSCCCSSWPFLGSLRCGLLSCPQLGTFWVHPDVLGSGHLAWPLWFGGPVSKEQCCNSFGVEFCGEEKDLLPSQRPPLGQVGLAPRHHESLCLTPHPISGNYSTRVTWLFSACRGMRTHTHRGMCIYSNTLGMPPHSHACSHSYMRAHS